VHQLAVRVAQHLHLDVTCAAHELLEIDLVVAEGGQGLAARELDERRQLVLAFDRAHAPPAAAPARLEHQRIAGPARQPAHFGDVARQRPGGRHYRHAGGDRQLAGRDLVAQGTHHLRARPMKRMPAAAQASAKSGFSERKP
jgi:hypothetical protein